MADIYKMIPKVLKWEGGYAGNIDGMICTMKGVTLATFRTFYGKDKTCKDLRNITDNQWMRIFKSGFWDQCNADKIENQSIAELIVDWNYASGVYGRKYAQEVIGVVADGIFGKKTIAAINNADQEDLFNRLWNRRKQHFYNIVAKNPSKKKFLKGWLNRLNDYKFVK